MIILYIPFYEDNDLIAKAISWKNTDEDKNILIIQHGTDINYNAISDTDLTIYILAHGIDDLLQHSFHLASNAVITDSTTYLDVEKIADRFNSDFTYIHLQVKNIKLYFCNNKGNQKFIAERFNNNLVLFNTQIDYYAGSLYPPLADKKKYAHYRGRWYSSSKVRSSVYHGAEDFESELDQRISVKKREILNFLEDAKQKRLEATLNRQRAARQRIFMSHRKDHMKKNETLEDASHPNALT